MGAQKERSRSGCGMQREYGTAVGSPVLHVTDGGRTGGKDGMVDHDKHTESAET